MQKSYHPSQSSRKQGSRLAVSKSIKVTSSGIRFGGRPPDPTIIHNLLPSDSLPSTRQINASATLTHKQHTALSRQSKSRAKDSLKRKFCWFSSIGASFSRDIAIGLPATQRNILMKLNGNNNALSDQFYHDFPMAMDEPLHDADGFSEDEEALITSRFSISNALSTVYGPAVTRKRYA